MDFARLGAIFRAVRLKKQWRQLDVASKAGVSRAAVSRLEQGQGRELGIEELLNIAEALGMSLRIVAGWRGGDLDRLINARHSALHESVARASADWDGWVLAPEVSFSIYGERGLIDLLGWHAETRTLLVIELKTEIVDINELMGKVDQKRRLAASIAMKRGWHPLVVGVWVIVAESSTNRRRVAKHRTVLRSACPGGKREVDSWLSEPAGGLVALSFWSGARGESFSEPLAVVKRIRRPSADAA